MLRVMAGGDTASFIPMKEANQLFQLFHVLWEEVADPTGATFERFGVSTELPTPFKEVAAESVTSTIVGKI